MGNQGEPGTGLSPRSGEAGGTENRTSFNEWGTRGNRNRPGFKNWGTRGNREPTWAKNWGSYFRNCPTGKPLKPYLNSVLKFLSEDDTAGTSRERGAKLPPWMAKSANSEQLATTDTTTKPTSSATTVNQPGEMVNPAGEAVPMSSSSESEEDEERAAKMRAMAAKFNPAQIYGEATVEKKDDKKSEKEEKENEDEGFSFGFLGGSDKKSGSSSKSEEISKSKKLYNREGKTPKYLPEDSGLEGQGFHKDGPLKGLPKVWQQVAGLRQRPKEANKPQFVEVPIEHLPPEQR